MPTLSSLVVAPEIATTCGTSSNVKVGIMTTQINDDDHGMIIITDLSRHDANFIVSTTPGASRVGIMTTQINDGDHGMIIITDLSCHGANFIVSTTSGASNNVKVGITTTLDFHGANVSHCIYLDWSFSIELTCKVLQHDVIRLGSHYVTIPDHPRSLSSGWHSVSVIDTIYEAQN